MRPGTEILGGKEKVMKKVYVIPNHSSSSLVETTMDELIKREKRPAFPDKPAYKAWCHDAGTDHTFYSMSQPTRAGLRVSKDNPVVALHGLVADYDSVIDEAQLRIAIAKCSRDFPIAYASRTFSGGARLVWIFERPLPVFGQDLAVKLLKRLAKEMKLTALLAGFDEKFFDPNMYYELGHDWIVANPEAVVREPMVKAALAEVTTKSNWTGPGETIDISVVAAEVERRWPGRWKGPFVVGAQGVRFWDPSSNNDTGAWIRETGVMAFSGENRFMPWTEILGHEFCSKHKRERIGGAISGIYYDGKKYLVRDDRGYWNTQVPDALRLMLIGRGLNRDKGKFDRMSEVEIGMNQINQLCRIDGCYPYLYRDEEVIETAGRRYLNTSRVRAMTPAQSHSGVWGEGFPWLADYLTQLFNDPEHKLQREHFLGWLKRLYSSAHAKNLAKCRVIFVAGPRSAGKTFLCDQILAVMLGAVQEAAEYIKGEDRFNGQMVEAPLWSINDSTASRDAKSHELYSQIVKRLAANFMMTYRPMYTDPVTMPWGGTVIVTMNDDPESIQMLPTIEGSILDKVDFYKVSATEVDFIKGREVLPTELKHFAAWLLKWEIPAEIQGTKPEEIRFGTKPFHHPELISTANHNSSTNSFAELLDIWRQEYFRTEGSDVTEWVGRSTDLHLALLSTETLKDIVNKTIPNSISVGRNLNKMAAAGCEWVTHGKRSAAARTYVIKRA